MYRSKIKQKPFQSICVMYNFFINYLEKTRGETIRRNNKAIVIKILTKLL